jgi:ribosomal protein S18 acetylase RimI-like enzyme
MTKDDIPSVVEIHSRILRDYTGITGDPDLNLEFMDLMGSYPEGCLVAMFGEKVVGFIIASQKHWGFGLGVSGWIEVVGVHPDHMGSGVGKALGKAILEHFTSQDINNVYTAVRWDGADMITFFKSIGFAKSEFINLKYTKPE